MRSYCPVPHKLYGLHCLPPGFGTGRVKCCVGWIVNSCVTSRLFSVSFQQWVAQWQLSLTACCYAPCWHIYEVSLGAQTSSRLFKVCHTVPGYWWQWSGFPLGSGYTNKELLLEALNISEVFWSMCSPCIKQSGCDNTFQPQLLAALPIRLCLCNCLQSNNLSWSASFKLGKCSTWNDYCECAA